MSLYYDRIFPVNVFSLLRENDDLNKELLIDIYKIRETDDSIDKSNKGGFHSPTNLNQRNIESFNRLEDELLYIVNSKVIKENFPKLSKLKCNKIDGMWFIINKLNDYNTMHTHSRSFISGAYYVKLPQQQKNCLHFEDPITIRKYENITPTQYIKEVCESMIVLFPGWLPHKVPTNITDEERIVISFNIDFPS